MKKFIAALLLQTTLSFASNLDYTVYLESWDANYISAYQGLVTNAASTIKNYDGVTLNLSFAAFTSTPAAGYPSNSSGLYGTAFGGSYGNQDTLINSITTYVHANGGKVQIAYGGNSYAAPYAPNYFISQTANWPTNSQTLAAGVAASVNALNLDGVDFDIEDPQPSSSTSQQFAQELYNFLVEVRAALPSKKITLTIPAQGWGQYWQYLAQLVAADATKTPPTVDAINFMEYDIWINPNVAGYVEQVKADIATYTSPTTESPAPNWAQGWGIPASMVQIGIMPGNDDTGQLMTTTDAQALTSYAKTNNLPGVFIWDIDRDALTSQTPTPFYPSTPYAFSNAIRATINQLQPQQASYSMRKPSKRFINYKTDFVKQINPSHGLEPYEN